MERTQLFDLMGELKLYGMKAAFDEIMATAVKRQHEPQRIVGDLLNAEISEKQARSIKYQLTIAKLPLAKDLDDFQFEGTPINETLVNDLAGGGFIAQQRNAVLVGRAGPARPIWPLPSPEAASAPAPVAGSTTWSISSTGSRPRPVTEGKVGSPINSLEWTSSFSTSSAICRSLNRAVSSCSTSSAGSTSAPRSSSPPISPSASGQASSVISKMTSRAARSASPPLRYHRDRQRQLALQEPSRRSHVNPRSPRLRNPRPAPTGRTLIAQNVKRGGPFWMPIRGPDPTPIDTVPSMRRAHWRAWPRYGQRTARLTTLSRTTTAMPPRHGQGDGRSHRRRNWPIRSPGMGHTGRTRKIVITPDRVLIGPDGTVRVQRIRTGRKTKSEPDKPIYALLAARRGAEISGQAG